MSSNKGFTLLELMVAIAIVAVMATITIPGWLSWRDSAKARGAANSLKADFERAKLRAVRENSNVCVLFTGNTAYQIFTDPNEDSILGAGEDTIADRALPDGVSITGNTFSSSRMSFNARGIPDGSAGTVTLTSAGGRRYEVVVSPFGRVRTEED
ncbi:MAG: prepilin-type N-terminal cleavage/methylation domain-containing protein [Desulfobacteraceae bacterium]|nr:prepilin-type N-terminal cleavage/methylation domain-containing protein [Desulfobacteraceae bacterium]MBC2749650.1 GspH/FimT family pseudopilin [Desulfobacteraceae bacterium]